MEPLPVTPPASQPSRRTVYAAILLLLVVAAGIFGYSALRGTRGHPETAAATPEPQPVATPAEPDELAAAVGQHEPARPREKSYVVPTRPAAAARAQTAEAAPSVLPAASVPSQQIIEKMAQFAPQPGAITLEQGTEFRNNLQNLVRQGAAAVPAIRQFLDKNQDVAFDEAGGQNAVGYSSLRAGLFDALKQIGGPEATETFLSTLRGTAEPAEIAAMARYLDEQAPGQYRQEVATAARETLAQAASGQVQLRETAPLFQMLQKYGDAEIAGDLARTAPQWNYYSTMALAGMPEGQGIPALVQSTQEAVKAGKSPNSFALQMLAQSASQSSEAAAALVEQARQNQIPDWTWTKIVEGLAGDQYQLGKPPSDAASPNGAPLSGLKTYHIESGNQNFYSLPFNLYGTPEQAAQRMAVVDQLISATQNPAALQALRNARAVLAAPAP